MTAPWAAIETAQNLIDVGRAEEALKTLPPALADPDTAAQALCVQARAYLAMDKPILARTSAEQALATEPTSEWANRLCAVSQLHLNQSGKALRHAEEAARLEPWNSAALYVLTVALLENGGRHARRAKEVAEECARVNPNDAVSYQALGMVAEAAKDWARAEHCYRYGLTLEPNDAELHLALARVLQSDGRKAEAAQSYAAAGELAPQDNRARQALTRIGLPILAFGVIGKLGLFYALRAGAVGGKESLEAVGLLNPPGIWATLVVATLAVGGVIAAVKVHGLRHVPSHLHPGLRSDIRDGFLPWVRAASWISFGMAAIVVLMDADELSALVLAALMVGLGVVGLLVARDLQVAPLPPLRERMAARFPTFTRWMGR